MSLPVQAIVSASRGLLQDRRGNVSIIFAFCLLSAIGLIGYAADYSVASIAKRKLDAAADAAVLNAVARSSNPTLDQPTQESALASFNAALGRASNITVSNVKLDSSYVSGNLQVKLSYTASVPTMFGSIFKVSQMNVSGQAASAAPLPPYANFYLLLDNSPSMGLGATTSDITKLQSLTQNNCAFACHQHVFDNGIVGDDTSDNYHIAKNNGVTTRIDVERTASQHFFDVAIKFQQSSERYKAAIYTFSDVLQIVAPMSSDLATVQSKASTVDLAYAYHSQKNIQTSFDTAFSYMNGIISTAGDGSSSASPMKYLFVVTDGVQDQPTGSASGSGDRPDTWAPPNQTKTSPPSDAQPNIANKLGWNVNNGRLISAIDPTVCNTLKNNKVKIAILYTTYIPVNDNVYTTYVKPIANDVVNNLQSCASPNLFFTVTPTQGIDEAMSAMFYAAAIGQPRLTQ